jgi:hypothetical protein
MDQKTKVMLSVLKGYTKSTDPTKFGVVADGNYTVNRLTPDEKPGPYGSDLGSKVPLFDNNGKVIYNFYLAYKLRTYLKDEDAVSIEVISKQGYRLILKNQPV